MTSLSLFEFEIYDGNFFVSVAKIEGWDIFGAAFHVGRNMGRWEFDLLYFNAISYLLPSRRRVMELTRQLLELNRDEAE